MASATRVVALVEREDTLRESMARALGVEGLAANIFADGAAAAAAFERSLPDLAILGNDAPSLSGSDLCRRLRARSSTLPLIVVTAREVDLDDRTLLHSGADDYLPKPFSIQEIMMRVKALLRRASLTGTEALAWEDRPLALGALTVDPMRLAAQWNGRSLELTMTEFVVLRALVQRAGIVKTRDQLAGEAYPGRVAADRIIDAHVRHIREKFEASEASCDAIEGVHDAGYRYRAGPSRTRA